MTHTTDFKQAKRIVDPKATTRAVLREPRCAICPNPSSNGHHVLSRSQGGDDVPENIVALCGSGTSGCHGLIENSFQPARALLGAYLVRERPDVVWYLQDKLGASQAREWLRRHLHTAVPLETVRS